jgi:hypothetical protein
MVEMLETAQILRQASIRSFVIMDEVGRGTTPKDGIAVAYGTIRHLLDVNKCRVLFATHFHELADLLDADGSTMSTAINRGRAGGVGCYCTDIEVVGVGTSHVGGSGSDSKSGSEGDSNTEHEAETTQTKKYIKMDSWVYVHKLRRGVNRNSHALRVAKLAGEFHLPLSFFFGYLVFIYLLGIPKEVLKIAGEVLEKKQIVSRSR